MTNPVQPKIIAQTAKKWQIFAVREVVKAAWHQICTRAPYGRFAISLTAA